jgi:glycosyltransferase involved in cell wall biosynthesis
MAMLEAAATGLPIISTPVSGTSLFLNQENSFLIDFKNADELSSALQKVYKIWKTESVFPTQNQIQFIRENFNWDKINLLYEKYLKSLSA